MTEKRSLIQVLMQMATVVESPEHLTLALAQELGGEWMQVHDFIQGDLPTDLDALAKVYRRWAALLQLQADPEWQKAVADESIEGPAIPNDELRSYVLGDGGE